MTDELLSFRALVVTPAEAVGDAFRQAAAASTVPVEMIAADAAAVPDALGDGADLAYIDGALPPEQIAQAAAALRAAKKPPFSMLLATGTATGPFATDALVGKPSRPEEAKWLLDRTIRMLLPSRVLVVDDSATMRSIVRKALAATRFQFEVSEADEGLAALQLVRDDTFDVVFLDQNMPGFSGFETLSELKREKRRVNVVMITSAQDEELEDRVRALGAAFLRKPFFPADIEAALCGYYGLRAINAKRD